MRRRKIRAQAKALLEEGYPIKPGAVTRAYKKTHPGSSKKSAENNGKRLLEHEATMAEFDKLFEQAKPFDVTKEKIITMYREVLQGWVNREDTRIKTADFLRALENLQKLCPEFVDRKEIDSYQHMSEDELDKAIADKARRFSVPGVN